MGAAPGRITVSPSRTGAPAYLPLPTKPQPAIAELTKPYQVGKASWYGGFFQGKATASGEDYDMYSYTAAHRELPLGTYVKVTNLRNLKSVIVRVNDRGPVTPGRIIDLSYNAARHLDMSKRGLQKVRIDILDAASVEMAYAQQPSAPR